jgi:hypothetical protein
VTRTTALSQPDLVFAAPRGIARFARQLANPEPLRGELPLKVVEANLIPGDYSGDGNFDAADYVVWRNGLGSTHTLEHYNIWRANFGRTAGSGSSGASGPHSGFAVANLPNSGDAAVPEPATLVLLIVAAAGVSTRRRKCAWRLSKLIGARYASTTNLDTAHQGQELTPLMARPWRAGNSSLRAVWHSVVA